MPVSYQTIDLTLTPLMSALVCQGLVLLWVFLFHRYSTVGAGHSFGSGVSSDALQPGQQPQCTGHAQSKTIFNHKAEGIAWINTWVATIWLGIESWWLVST